MSEILKIAGLMALSGVKFFLAPPLILLSGYNYFETILISCCGGTIGVLVFFYFGEWIKMMIRKLPKRKRKNPKRMFTRSNRRIVRLKSGYGLIGLVILTPCILSIPVGSLLAARYFDHNKLTIPYLLISVITWSFLLTSFTFLFD